MLTNVSASVSPMNGERPDNLKQNFYSNLIKYLLNLNMCNIRGRSDKYLASPSEGATIAREIYYRVVHSRRRLLSTFQSNRTRSFILTACGNGRVRGFYKNGKEQYQSVIRFLFLEGKSRSEIKERLDAVYGDSSHSSPSMATVKN